MLNLAKLIKPWKESGALNAQLNLFGFWNQTTFLTKSGGVGMVLRIGGIDYESLDKATQNEAVMRLERAFKMFSPSFRVYQYLFKQNRPDIPFQIYGDELIDSAVKQRKEFFDKKADELYQIDLYYVILYENPRSRPGLTKALAGFMRDPKQALHDVFTMFSETEMMSLLRTDVVEDVAAIRRTVSTFMRHLQMLCDVELMDMDGQFAFFRRLLNYDAQRRAGHPRSSQYLDYQVANSSITVERDHLKVGDQCVRVLTMKEGPSRTRPMLLDQILKLDATFVVCIEWNVLAQDRAKAMINSRRRFHNTAKGSTSKENVRERDELIDEGMQADIEQLGEVLRAIGEGQQLGELSLTVVLYAKTTKQLDNDSGKLQAIMSNLDGVLFPETYNQRLAFFAIVPGNTVHNLRRMLFFRSHYADMSFLFTIHLGDRINRYLKKEYLAVLETDNKTPYFLNLHCGQVGHTLILGMTGAGKSFTCNFLLNSAQKYKPLTYIFDIGGSFESLTRMYGGAYVNVGQSSHDFHINPFCLQPTEENLNFLYSLIRVILEINGKYSLSTDDETTLWDALTRIYEIDPKHRTLTTFASLTGRLKRRFDRWTKGGQYGWLFDNETDSVTFATFQTYNFSGWSGDSTDALVPLLFYVLHRATNSIVDPANKGRVKYFLWDEVWKFLENPTIRQYITEGQKTWRKNNASLILSTQQADDLEKSEMLDLVKTSCPTKIFLANPDMDRKFYADAFNLKDTEVETIASLIPPGQFLVRRARASKKVHLNVDSVSYWMSTNNAMDNLIKDEYFARYGVTEGIKRLAAERPFLATN
jgi:type IV secretion system protein VirB4